MNLGI
jgi:hypothetical protein